MIMPIIEPHRQVKGNVFNNKHEPLEANISIKNTHEGVAADKDGKFVLKSKRALPLVLLITHVGYEPKELTIDEKSSTSPLNIVLNENVMEEFVVSGYSMIGKVDITGGSVVVIRETLFNDFKQRLMDTLKFSSHKTNSKIYPNPLSKSSMLTIELNNLKTGNYSVSVADMSGRRLQIEQINVQHERIQKQIRLRQNTAPGTYIITVIDPNGRRLSSQKLIVRD